MIAITQFPAFVDVDEKYSINDKISMVNTLVQVHILNSHFLYLDSKYFKTRSCIKCRIFFKVNI